MSEELERLRRQSAQLRQGEWEEWIACNEAILRLSAGDLIATRRLALALVRSYDLDRAEEVIEEALERNPEDEVLTKRLEDVASGRRTGLPDQLRKREIVETEPGTWLKAVHYDGDGWVEEPGTEWWISDPGQRRADGSRQYRSDGVAWGCPSWKVGEEVGIYYSGTKRVPMLVVITAPPSFDQARVAAAHWAQPGDEERWPWVTEIRAIASLPVEDAPTLDDLGIESASMQQRARLKTDPEIHHRLRRAFGLGT